MKILALDISPQRTIKGFPHVVLCRQGGKCSFRREISQSDSWNGGGGRVVQLQLPRRSKLLRETAVLTGTATSANDGHWREPP